MGFDYTLFSVIWNALIGRVGNWPWLDAVGGAGGEGLGWGRRRGVKEGEGERV